MVDFTVKDSKVFKSSDGKTYKEYIPMGVNVRGSGYGSALWNPTDDIPIMLKTWKYNTLRINVIGDSYGSNTGHNNDYEWTAGASDVRDLKALIKKCLDAGLETVQICPRLNGSDGAGVELTPGNPSVQQLKSFWKKWATLYKDNPRVWFNVVNEPDAKEGSDLRDAYKEILKEIRATGANNVVVLDSIYLGKDITNGGNADFPASESWMLNNAQSIVDSYKNVVFSLHMYGSGWRPSNTTTDSTAKIYEAAKKKALTGFKAYLDKKLCFHVGEYNVNDIDNKEPNGKDRYYNQDQEAAAAQGIVDASIQYQIGTIPWSWSNLGGDDSGPCTTGSGAAVKVDSSGKPTNLNRLGKIMWADINRPAFTLAAFSSGISNPVPTPTPNPTPVPTPVITPEPKPQPVVAKTIALNVTIEVSGETYSVKSVDLK